MAEEEELVDYEEEEEQAPADQANGKVRRVIRRKGLGGGLFFRPCVRPSGSCGKGEGED